MEGRSIDYAWLTDEMPPRTVPEMDGEAAFARLTALRQYQAQGLRAPHKPLLVLLALSQLANTGSSELPWSVVEQRLGSLLREFGPPTADGAPKPSFPFTRLRSDGVWLLSENVPNDAVGPLREGQVTGRLTPDIEEDLARNPAEVDRIVRAIVGSQFPATIAPDVLMSVGFDPGLEGVATERQAEDRRRSARWRDQVITAWDRACAFCGFDGSIAGAPVGIEAAHVRWFNFGGPDDLDNGLALCSLHHKLLDRGVLGLSDPETIAVSSAFAASSDRGRQVYDLHGARLRPRPGTRVPRIEHIQWHRSEVFKGAPLEVIQ